MKICPQMVPIAQYYIILSTFDQEKLYIGKIRSNFIPTTPKRSALGPQMRGVNWSHPDKFSDWPIFLAILLHFQLKSIPRFKFLQYISQNNHILCNFNNNITYNGGGVICTNWSILCMYHAYPYDIFHLLPGFLLY